MSPIAGRALALVCCLALSLLSPGCDFSGEKARDGNSGSPPATKASPDVPKALANGDEPPRLPQGFRRYRGLDVIGAKTIPGTSKPARSCPFPSDRLRSKATLSGAWISTEGLSVEYEVDGYPPLYMCDAVWKAGRWQRCGAGAARSQDPLRIERAGGLRYYVCPLGVGRVSFQWIAVRRQAAWTLVDHDSFWVAYSSGGRKRLRVSFRRIFAPMHVVYLDRAGRTLAEKLIQGSAAS